MATTFSSLVGVFSFLLLLAGVVARSDLCVIFRSAEGYQQLNSNQKRCGIDTFSSVCYVSTCKDKDCLCADPQFMSDHTDECMVKLDNSRNGMYSVDTYNGIMAFFGTECGTFEVQFKVTRSAEPHHGV